MGILETVEKSSAMTFACHYYIKGKKQKQQQKTIKTIPAFPPVLCFSTLHPRSLGSPLPHQRSELAEYEGFRQVRGPRPLGWSPPLIGLTACHSHLGPTPANRSRSSVASGAFNVANNEGFFFFWRRAQVVLQLVHSLKTQLLSERSGRDCFWLFTCC